MIVGWYDNATVYRNRQSFERNGEKQEYNIETKAENAHLVPDGKRSQFIIPKARNGEFGIGQSNVKYVEKDDDRIFADKAIDFIESIRKTELEEIKQESENIKKVLEEDPNFLELSDTEKETIVKQRVGQGRFRDELLNRDGRCRICGLENPKLLIASHIKAWSDCNSGDERIDSNNGIILCKMHDALFDNHLITFDEEGKIVINQELSETDLNILNISHNFYLNMTNKMKEYMKFHRKKYQEKNQYVEHSKFGKGKIIDIDNDGNFVVHFENDDTIKKLASDAFKKELIKKV